MRRRSDWYVLRIEREERPYQRGCVVSTRVQWTFYEAVSEIPTLTQCAIFQPRLNATREVSAVSRLREIGWFRGAHSLAC